jgi:hypothetical protein
MTLRFVNALQGPSALARLSEGARGRFIVTVALVSQSLMVSGLDAKPLHSAI